jgi:signal transduction histidine kinase
MKRRFIAAITAVTLLVLLVQDVPLALYMHQNEQNKITGTLQRDALVLAGRSQSALWAPSALNTKALSELAATYRKNGGARIVIVNAVGKAIVTSDDDQLKVGQSFATRPEIAAALKGQLVQGVRYSESLKENLLYVTVPVYNGNVILGAVRLTFPEKVVNDAVNNQVWVLALVALTTILLAAIAGTYFARGVTRRLRELEVATERLADGDLTARADERSGAPELRNLARSFNTMTSRLEALIEQQKSFASDASHQLRTPLTALRLRLEKASELIATDPAGAAERLRAAEAETDRLSNIIEGLLALSRSEAASVSTETVDLAAIVAERVAHWQPLADENSVLLRLESPESALALAVPTAVEQIFDNFVDNALSVSQPNSELLVRVSVDHLGVTLSVSDEGPGLSPADCERAFDRFWRASSETPGSGLGLAIVAQLAQASSARAELRPRQPNGLEARVTFNAPRA